MNQWQLYRIVPKDVINLYRVASFNILTERVRKLIIPKGYTEVCLDSVIEFTPQECFFKTLMESLPICTKERKNRISSKKCLNGARIIGARQGYDV